MVVKKNTAMPITEIEHSAFCSTSDQLKVKTLSEEFGVNVRWQKIPEKYLTMQPDELDVRISKCKEILQGKVKILGHHYQRDEVIKHADFEGDSFKLSKEASESPDAEYIVFCGVHFMAETACIVCSDDQKVFLPNINAGCSMADMAPTDDVLDAWDDIVSLVAASSVVPITYMNSTASIKALCGEHGGIVCTSSNAKKIFEWAFSKGDKVFFIPDQHLGRNTAVDFGISLEDIVVWNPFKPFGGLSSEQIKKSKVIVWQGHCSVHTRFSAQQIVQARSRYKDINILVHPECPLEVIEAADYVGSTEYIINTVNKAAKGTIWGIGTEISLVNRLARLNPDKTIFCLDPIVCPCSTMYRIHPAYLLWVLEGLCNGIEINRITVDDNIKRNAFVALERMLQIN